MDSFFIFTVTNYPELCGIKQHIYYLVVLEVRSLPGLTGFISDKAAFPRRLWRRVHFPASPGS
jgi:hypothetical protein